MVEIQVPDEEQPMERVENRRFVHRADALRQVSAAVRFISAEPLLGCLDGLDLSGIHWLIAGGESGHRRRPVRPEWVLHLRDICQREGVAFFFKQWGGRYSKAGPERSLRVFGTVDSIVIQSP